MADTDSIGRRQVVRTVGTAAAATGLASVGMGTVTAQTSGEIEFLYEQNFNSVTDPNLEFFFVDSGNTHSVEAASNPYDLSQLPETNAFIVTASDGDGYIRRKYFPSTEDGGTHYILGNAIDIYTVQFQLNDYTGQFDKENTLLRIERPLDGEFTEIYSDFFGATGEFEAELEQDTRNRLSILNTETGEERFLGVVSPKSDNLYTLDVRTERAEIIEEGEPLVSIRPSTKTLAASDTSTVTISVNERDSTLDEWTAIITYENGSGSQELYNQTHGNSTTEISPTVNLEDRSGGEVNVTVETTTTDGTTSSRGALYRVREFIDHNRSLLAVLASWGDELGTQDATTFIAILGSVLVTGGAANSMRVSKEALGGIALMSLLGFAVIGWVPFTLIFACGVTYVTLWAVRRGI